MLSKISIAQNLVPNPSFEIFTNCPQFNGQIDFADGWSSFKESPDYFNSCANTSQPLLGIPNNERGTQATLNGNAYIGMISYGKTIPNVREHAGIQLSQSLIPGTKYFVSFWVSRCDTFSYDCAINKLGARFSTIPYSNVSPSPVDNFAHVYTDTIIMDKNSWYNINGSFIADSTYSYCIIGNFFDDAHTDTASCSTPVSSTATYYFDGICVSVDSLECANAFTAIHEIYQPLHFIVLSDPSSIIITIISPSDQNLINLYDAQGQLCVKKYVNSSKIEINTMHLSEGVYFLQIVSNNKSYSQKILISH
jgi:hypothetical protein